jgi:hypothetical protein
MPDFDLLMAVFHEHEQRTGHDVTKEPVLGTLKITCDVCLYLDKLMKQAQEEMAPPAEEPGEETP